MATLSLTSFSTDIICLASSWYHTTLCQSRTSQDSVYANTLRNQIQATVFLVQTVRSARLRVFDFAAGASSPGP